MCSNVEFPSEPVPETTMPLDFACRTSIPRFTNPVVAMNFRFGSRSNRSAVNFVRSRMAQMMAYGLSLFSSAFMSDIVSSNVSIFKWSCRGVQSAFCKATCW